MIPELIAGGLLATSSIKDLRTRKGLKDSIYIIGILSIAGGHLLQSPTLAGASILQAILGIAAGILFRLSTNFGGADIWTLGIIAATFPEIIILQLLAICFIPLVLWLKVFQLAGRKSAPAIPALFMGFLILLLNPV